MIRAEFGARWQSRIHRDAAFELPSRKHPKRRRRCALPAHSIVRSTPKSLLQVIESLDDFFLHQMLAVGNDWPARDNNLPHRRARKRKDNAGKQVVTAGSGNRRIIQSDSEEIRGSSRFEDAAGSADAARAVPSGAGE